MFGNIFSGFFSMIWGLIQIPVYILLGATAILMGIFIWHTFYWKVIKGCKISGTEHYRIKKEGLLKVIWNGLKQAAYDRATRNIEHIPEKWTGIYMIEGLPGTGKTTSAVYDAILKRNEYPKLKTYTNMEVTFQDGSINSWKDVMKYDNKEFGQIFILDEIGNLLNARSWKDFPPEALQLITQSRKIRTRILASCQDFGMCDINLRRLTKEVWRPITFMRTICFVLKYKPKINSEGKVEKMKLRRIEYYRQDSELRSCFDTRKQIKKLAKEGFAPRESQLRQTEGNQTNIEITNKKKR